LAGENYSWQEKMIAGRRKLYLAGENDIWQEKMIVGRRK